MIGLSGGGDEDLYPKNKPTLAKKNRIGMANSSIEGGNWLMMVLIPKKAAMMDRAPKVRLLNIFFWNPRTCPRIFTAGSGAPD